MHENRRPFTEAERRDMNAMRNWVLDHYKAGRENAYEELGGKLFLIDRILGAGWIEKSDPQYILKHQCLGIAFGDALVQSLGLDWDVYEDEEGRTPALFMTGTPIVLFPQTMISRRIEDGETVDVYELFTEVEKRLLEIKNELTITQ